ncbi:hypothetical protein OC844_005718 [Tilletia horrida]|nr:hypothetical protein OC844_005718 [Tilletia horrida]
MSTNLSLSDYTAILLVQRAAAEIGARLELVHHDDLIKRTTNEVRGARTEKEKDDILNRHNLLLAQAPPPDWRAQLLALDCAWTFEPGSRVVMIERTPVPGLAFFDQLRAPAVGIRSPKAFAAEMSKRTKGVLAGLDYTNMVMAGGFPLSCLVTNPRGGPLFQASDIDLYLYASSGTQATRKALHIQEVIDKNVGNFEQHYHIVRTMGTLTFVPKAGTGSKYPKIQLVMKIHYNGLDVIANFDRDEVSMAWDGAELYLDVRAVRAVNEGFSVLTEKLIKSTSMARTIKYAQRGFGLISRISGATRVERDAVRATATGIYDWMFECIKASRFDEPGLGVPHKSINMRDVMKAIHARVGESWLASFTAFAHAAALWDHLCARCDDLEPLFRGVQSPVYLGLETSYDSLIAEDEEPSLGEQWETAMSQAVATHAGSATRGMFQAVVMSHHGVFASQLLAKCLYVPLYLPLGFRENVFVDTSTAASRKHLRRIAELSTLTDSGGNEFEVCMWTLGVKNCWPEAHGQERLFHTYLRAAGQASHWATTQIASGKAFQDLDFGAVLKKCVHDICFCQAVDGANSTLLAWFKT